MEQDRLTLSPLGVAREFAVADDEVGMAAHHECGVRSAECGVQSFQRTAIPLHNESIRPRHRSQRRLGIDPQDERVVQATWPLEHRSTAAAAAQNRDFPFPTGRNVDLAFHPIRVTDHDEVLLRFPETQHFRAVACVAPVEQRLVTGEVFFGRRKCQVEVVHASRSRLVEVGMPRCGVRPARRANPPFLFLFASGFNRIQIVRR